MVNRTESELKRIQNLTLDAFCTKNGLVMASSRTYHIKVDYITTILHHVSEHSKAQVLIVTNKF